ncbi:hypothetical protein [Staphylococcus shinii]|uniref:hypothetical protein n=1 Tax=Staphylococcus shinii TaxID=2912228 RepID=UPI003EEC3FD7
MQNNQPIVNTVLSVIIAISIIVILFMSINLYNKYKEDDKIKNDILAMKKENKQTVKQNQKVDNMEKDQENELKISEVSNIAEKFNEKFFVWDTWESFSNNMKSLRASYPNLKDNDNVVIDGKDVGTGTSPESSYSTDIYTTENKQEIAELIKQNKNYEEKTTEKLWYKVSTYKDGEYDITKFQGYEKVL